MILHTLPRASDHVWRLVENEVLKSYAILDETFYLQVGLKGLQQTENITDSKPDCK